MGLSNKAQRGNAPSSSDTSDLDAIRAPVVTPRRRKATETRVMRPGPQKMSKIAKKSAIDDSHVERTGVAIAIQPESKNEKTAKKILQAKVQNEKRTRRWRSSAPLSYMERLHRIRNTRYCTDLLQIRMASIIG